MIAEFKAILYDLFVNYIFGDLTLTGLFMLSAFLYMAITWGLTIDALAAILIPLIVILGFYGFLPFWMVPVLLIICGLTLYFAVTRVRNR